MNSIKAGSLHSTLIKYKVTPATHTSPALPLVYIPLWLNIKEDITVIMNDANIKFTFHSD